MKKLYLTLTALSIFINFFAQTGFSYQGVLRDETGKLRTNETLNLTATLLQDNLPVYIETHQVVTNSYGVFSIIIGSGVSQTEFSPSLFLNTDSTSIKTTFLKVEEGSKIISNTQILGVPFAEVSKVALKAHIDFPAGTIVAFAGDTLEIPSGWLLCDGKLYDKTAYPDLFKAIKSHWGAETTKFRVPDLRGVFIRGVNYNANDKFADPDYSIDRKYRHPNGNTGNTVGSYQDDILVSHNHSVPMDYGTRTAGSHPTWAIGTGSAQETAYKGGNETRPVNAYVNYIIKF